MPKSNKDSKSTNATNTQVDPIKELRTLIGEICKSRTTDNNGRKHDILPV